VSRSDLVPRPSWPPKTIYVALGEPVAWNSLQAAVNRADAALMDAMKVDLYAGRVKPRLSWWQKLRRWFGGRDV